MNYKHIISLLFLGFLFISCNKEAEIPSYLQIEKIPLLTKGNQGTDKDNIQDAWISVDGLKIGTFQLPCKVPIVKNGNDIKVRIRAGINLNGIAGSKSDYYAYNDCIIKNIDGDTLESISLSEDETTTIYPVVTYKESISFKVLEDFESAGIAMESTKFVDTTLADSVYSAEMVKTTEDVFEGTHSGKIELSTAKKVALITTTAELDIPELHTKNFIEIHYKTDVPVEFGIWYNNSVQTQLAAGGVNPNEEWKKIIFQIKPETVKSSVANIPNATKYKFYIKANLPSDKDKATILLDNFKLIHQ
jgi:hypothetical protein